MLVAIKVHMILQSIVMLTWMHDIREIMEYGIWNNKKCNIAMLKLMILCMRHGLSPKVAHMRSSSFLGYV